MPEVLENISLKKYNTFAIEANTRYFASFGSIQKLMEILKNPKFRKTPRLILGGGSNILFKNDFEGLVLQNNILGINCISEDKETITLQVGAGEDWDDLVAYTVKNNWSGLENLSYIPGNVGASPIQNIGAYGEEVKNTITEVETIDLEKMEKVVYPKSDCKFGYRNSIFKQELKGKRLITHVIFRLNKKHIFNLDYGVLKETVEKNGKVNLHNVRNSVIAIRKSKLPEPEELGSAGSFFKNPVIQTTLFTKLKKQYPDIPHYPVEQNQVKIPAGWLIDKLGWKGYREGDAGVHKNQALVLVNYGKASGQEIFNLSQKIVGSVQEKYGIELEYEVNVV